MSKQSDGSCLQEKPRDIWKTHFLVLCQIDVVNKQLISSLSWVIIIRKNFMVSHILIICIHLDTKEKHSLDFEGVYNMPFHVKDK